MLRKGYAIFVETDEGPVRVHDFNPWKMTYIIREAIEEETSGQEAQAPKPKGRTAKAQPEPKSPGASKLNTPGFDRRGRRVVERQVPVAGSKATAVGRTAGG